MYGRGGCDKLWINIMTNYDLYVYEILNLIYAHLQNYMNITNWTYYNHKL